MNKMASSPLMESIKKKMQGLKQEIENASERTDQAEKKTKDLEDKLKLVYKHLYNKHIYLFCFCFIDLINNCLFNNNFNTKTI